MKEILFRGKMADCGEWVEGLIGYDVWGSIGIERFIEFGVIETIQPILETLGQYTGLDDKNGKKIFQGDILSVNGYCYDETSFNAHGEIVDTPLGIGLYFKNNKGKTEMLLLSELQGSYLTEYEVLGNVYDNPEILK